MKTEDHTFFIFHCWRITPIIHSLLSSESAPQAPEAVDYDVRLQEDADLIVR